MEQDKPIGIILCGGESSRMGIDKSQINYHGVSQREHLRKLLGPFCSPVLYSIGKQQEEDESTFSDLPEFMGHGPSSGLLSIHHYFPNRDVLLIGCDYPLIKQMDLHQLIDNQKEELDAICYASGITKRPEPLLTYYSASFCDHIHTEFTRGEYSLKRILDKAKTLKLEIDDPLRLISADSPEHARRVRQIIQAGFDTFEA